MSFKIRTDLLPFLSLFALILVLGSLQSHYAFAQVDMGGKSMMNEMPFIKDIATTAQDILYLSAKIIGAGLAFVGVKNAGQRHWDHAIPAFIGSAGLFFLPQIVAALAKVAG